MISAFGVEHVEIAKSMLSRLTQEGTGGSAKSEFGVEHVISKGPVLDQLAEGAGKLWGEHGGAVKAAAKQTGMAGLGAGATKLAGKLIPKVTGVASGAAPTAKTIGQKLMANKVPLAVGAGAGLGAGALSRKNN